MGFKNLSPPPKYAAVDPAGIRVSTTRSGRKENAPLVVNVSIGAELFEEFGEPDRVAVLMGEGPDAGKLQLKAQHPDSDVPGFPIKVFSRSGTAVVRVGLPGIKREVGRTAIEHDLNDDELTFLLPREIFHPLPASHSADEARTGRGGGEL